ncbi:uncharacterized protein L201_007506 [Kwoniella dendrophila CBS 6074]|uniref:Uncharacterized protein n=1 Tax=Kwoniella dendrophila CBS 6074 TaxID=1295534 RepID=A0AAX4K6Q7_9TREE
MSSVASTQITNNPSSLMTSRYCGMNLDTTGRHYLGKRNNLNYGDVRTFDKLNTLYPASANTYTAEIGTIQCDQNGLTVSIFARDGDGGIRIALPYSIRDTNGNIFTQDTIFIKTSQALTEGFGKEDWKNDIVLSGVFDHERLDGDEDNSVISQIKEKFPELAQDTESYGKLIEDVDYKLDVFWDLVIKPHLKEDGENTSSFSQLESGTLFSIAA